MSARLAVAAQLVCALLLLSGPSHPTAAAEPAPLPEAPARDKPAQAGPDGSPGHPAAFRPAGGGRRSGAGPQLYGLRRARPGLVLPVLHLPQGFLSARLAAGSGEDRPRSRRRRTRRPWTRLRACLDVVVQRMPHYILLGYNGAPDRGMTEEDLLQSGHGWCNEQARVLVALTQIAGLPSRLVFAQSRDSKIAHVVTEVYVDGKWVLVDQTEGLDLHSARRPPDQRPRSPHGPGRLARGGRTVQGPAAAQPRAGQGQVLLGHRPRHRPPGASVGSI